MTYKTAAKIGMDVAMTHRMNPLSNTIKNGIMVLTIMFIMLFVGSLNQTRADGCDCYNGPVSLHPDPDRFYPINLAFCDSSDRDYNNDLSDDANTREDRLRSNGDYERVEYRQTSYRDEDREGNYHERRYNSENRTVSDPRLSREIRRALHRDHSLSSDARNIDIHVHNGIVTLRGAVDTRSERRNVVAKVGEIAGEDNVRNHLSILPR
jgi:hypothetical protein